VRAFFQTKEAQLLKPVAAPWILLLLLPASSRDGKCHSGNFGTENQNSAVPFQLMIDVKVKANKLSLAESPSLGNAVHMGTFARMSLGPRNNNSMIQQLHDAGAFSIFLAEMCSSFDMCSSKCISTGQDV